MTGDDLASAVTYDAAELERTLGELESMFTELKYLDDALDYMAGKEAEWWQGHGFVDPGSFTMELEFGTTAPFTKWYRVPEKMRFFWQESREAEVDGHLSHLADTAARTAADDMASIRERIAPFTGATAPYEGDILKPLERAHLQLTDEVSTDFGLLRHHLGDWEGEAADNFASRFYHPFGDTLRSQQDLLAAFAGGLATAKAIAESSQHSIMAVVCHTRDAVREQLTLRQQHAEVVRQQSARNALVITGSVATMLAAVTGGAGLWGISMATAAGSTSIASTGVPNELADLYTLGGSNYDELRDALYDAIDTIDKRDDEQHEEHRRETASALERVEDLRTGPSDGNGRLIPITPEVVHGVDGSNFYLA